MSETVADRVRARLKEEMVRQDLSQRDVAGLLKWPQSRVSKILNGRIGLDVNDVAALCFAMSLSPVEAIRDPGLEFMAELSPSELRLIHYLRRLPADVMDAALKLILFRLQTNKPDRYAGPLKKLKGTRS